VLKITEDSSEFVLNGIQASLRGISDEYKEFLVFSGKDDLSASLEDFKRKSVISLDDWKSNVTKGKEAIKNLEIAEEKMAEMRQAYLRDLLKLREQLQRQQYLLEGKGDGKGDINTDLIMNFNPTAYSTSKERESVECEIRKRAEILMQQQSSELTVVKEESIRVTERMREQLETAKVQLKASQRQLQSYKVQNGKAEMIVTSVATHSTEQEANIWQLLMNFLWIQRSIFNRRDGERSLSIPASLDTEE